MARTEKYLPAKSRVVVRTPNKTVCWYDTQKEVIITDAGIAQCPMTGESVYMVVVGGIAIWYQSRMVRSRIVLEDGDIDENSMNEQYSLMHYDVPSNGESAGYSPCNELYRVAVRLTKSAWIVKTGDVPYDLIGRMQDIGCKVCCNKFDKSETRSLMCQAIEQLQLKMDEATRDAEESYQRAALQLTNSGDVDSREYMDDETKATERFIKRTTLIEKRLKELADNIQTGVVKFGISTKSFRHDRLAGMARLTRTRTQEQAHAYHRATVALSTSTDTTARTLATNAANSTLPPYVMADALREAGDEATADALTETFSLVGHGIE